MTRRPLAPPVDHRRDRAQWVALINDAHAAIAEDRTVSISHLGDRANGALRVWNPPAPYPRGLVCGVFAAAVHAWARQSDPEARARLTPLVIASAGLVDELLNQTALDAAPTMPAASADLPAGLGGRLPYREN